MPFGPTHTIILGLAHFATRFFYSRIEIEGEENVPKVEDGPLLVVANHWNTAVDPAMLSVYFPHERRLHYWAKSTLFKNKIVKSILLDAGNISVDRSNKDNQKLFASTFDMLKYGECIAIFPEGTSYTMPGITSFKDGASWAALEYAKNWRETGKALSTGGRAPAKKGEQIKDAIIVIAGLNYTEKSKYRSSALIQYGPSISVAPYVEEFLKDPKSAVKKLTKEIHEALIKVTVNAKDWDTLQAASMARKMLWVDERTLPLARYRDIAQTLVNLFATAEQDARLASLRDLLLAYQQSLQATKLTHYTLAGVPLPATLDPSIPHPLPTRFRVLFSLIATTFGSLVRLPFFLLPMIVHLPIYAIGKYAISVTASEEEGAQNKIAFGLVLGLLTYSGLFFAAWLLLLLNPIGLLISVGFVWLFAQYHNRLVDDNYNGAKKLMASWRVLVGTWAPRAKSEAVHALRRFGVHEEVKGENKIRRVLRLRLEASTALADYLLEREKEPEGAEGRILVERLHEWRAKISRPKPGQSIATTKVE